MTTPESNEMANLPSPATTAGATAEPSTSTATTSAPPAAPTTTTTTTSTQTPPSAAAADKPTTSTSTSIPEPVDPITPAPQASSSSAAAADSSDSATPADGPAVLITLLLPSTNARHPYKIDAKYLRKRNVTVEDNDPFNLPVQTLKELILRDWRDDWDAKPNSPSAIRLISMGLELQEGEQLRDKRFSATGPNIVHMVIKRELPEDEEIKDSKRSRTDEEGARRSSNCCGCVIL